ncbi:MAG: hypothetical protein JWQ22_2232 [Devosia sp.]|nr:hypothetical protein [Devosia sp.]
MVDSHNMRYGPGGLAPKYTFSGIEKGLEADVRWFLLSVANFR